MGYDVGTHHDPERSRVVGGKEHVSAVEWLRRNFPGRRPVSTELGSWDQTVLRLGQMAASIARGRRHNLPTVKLYHPLYAGGVNGWPTNIWSEAWHGFTVRYTSLTWDLDPDWPERPQPTTGRVPVTSQPLVLETNVFGRPTGNWVSTGLQAKVQESIDRRRQERLQRDSRWRAAMEQLTMPAPGESPQQALVRRTSAAGALLAIEQEVLGQ